MEQNLEKTVNLAKESDEALLARLFGRGWTIERQKKTSRRKDGPEADYDLVEVIGEILLVPISISEKLSNEAKIATFNAIVDSLHYLPLGICDLHYLLENPEHFPEDWESKKQIRFPRDIICNHVGELYVLFAFYSGIKWRWGITPIASKEKEEDDTTSEDTTSAVIKKQNAGRHKQVA